MSNYEIFTDAAADLPPEWYQQYSIQGVSMDYTIEGKNCTIFPNELKRESVSEAFYAALRKGVKTTTTQITPYQYIEAFSPALNQGKDILYCCFSSGMSGTWHNAVAAADLLKEQYPERTVRCVDTLSSSAGLGLIVLRAAVLREEGKSMEESALWLEEHRQKMNHWFMVDDLEHLKRGGRVSPAVAFLGSKLQIKPILSIAPDGKLAIAEKVRGRRQSMERLVKLFQSFSDLEDVPAVVLLNYAGCREDGEHLVEMVQQAAPPNTQIYAVALSPIVGVHTGPGMLSVCFWGKPR